MKLIVNLEFHDAEADVIRKPGDILTVSEARGKALLGFGLNIVSAIEEEPEKPISGPETEAPKKRRNAKKT